MRYYELNPPMKLRAGFKDEQRQQPLYFDCCACSAKEPEIAGVLASEDGTADGRLAFDKIAVLDSGPPGRLALYCAACFATIVNDGLTLPPDSPPDASAPGTQQQQQQQQTNAHMTATIKNGKLILEIELNEHPTPSASGKTLVVASTHGNIATTATVNGKPVIVGLNAYIKPN